MNRALWRSLVAGGAVVLAACSSGGTAPSTTAAVPPPVAVTAGTEPGGDLAGTRVIVLGPDISDEESGGHQDALDVFAAQSGIEIVYTGAPDALGRTGDAEADPGADIALFPGPGALRGAALRGDLAVVPDTVVAAVAPQWPESWMEFGRVGDEQFGIPNRSDLKSLVWYNTQVFADHGYDVPRTWDGLLALTSAMIGDGVTPWCVGIASGGATGWPVVDWVEDVLLRVGGVDVYDRWLAHEIPSTDEAVASAFRAVLDLWSLDGAVLAVGGSISTTPFGANGAPLAAGRCAMHRQGTLFADFLPPEAEIGPGGVVDVFAVPPAAPGERPALVAGTLAAALRDAPEVWAVMEYLGSADYADARQRSQQGRREGGRSGYLSANLRADLESYLPFEQVLVEILRSADPSRFGASDVMPPQVAEGALWRESASVVAGDTSLESALAAIDAAWPAG